MWKLKYTPKVLCKAAEVDDVVTWTRLWKPAYADSLFVVCQCGAAKVFDFLGRSRHFEKGDLFKQDPGTSPNALEQTPFGVCFNKISDGVLMRALSKPPWNVPRRQVVLAGHVWAFLWSNWSLLEILIEEIPLCFEEQKELYKEFMEGEPSYHIDEGMLSYITRNAMYAVHASEIEAFRLTYEAIDPHWRDCVEDDRIWEMSKSFAEKRVKLAVLLSIDPTSPVALLPVHILAEIINKSFL
jgi:hypothetical protein